MSGSTLGPSTGPPPPVPRRHPSRPSLRSTSSSGPGSTPPSLPTELPEKPLIGCRPTSSLYSGDEAIRTSTVGLGYAGRVGLGSPRLEFFPRRDTAISGEGSEDRDARGGRRGSYIDDRSGLPSPPGTESDVGMGKGGTTTEPTEMLSSLDEDIPSATKTRLRPRTPSVASSTHSVHPLPRSTSSATSLTQSSRRRLQPKVPAGMTRSASSSSSVYTLSLRDVKLPSSSGGSSGMSDKSASPIKRSSPALPPSNHVSHVSPSPSSPDRLSRHSSRHSIGTVPLKGPAESPASGSGQGRKASASSHGGTGGKLSRHSSRLSLGSYSSADVAEEADVDRLEEVRRVEPVWQETEGRALRRSPRCSLVAESSPPAASTETAVKLLRRISGSADYDDRIRAAEEKVNGVNSRPMRPSTSTSVSRQHHETSPPKSTLRRDSPKTGGTLRRSATLSSASARSQQSPVPAHTDTPEKGATNSESMRERDQSGGSSGSGKRKPLPTEFRSPVPYTPSPKSLPQAATLSGSSRVSRPHQLADSPEDRMSDLPLSPHLTSPPQRGLAAIDSPSSRFLRHEGVDNPERSSSSSTRKEDGYSRRQWSESLSGLPNPRQDTNHRGSPRNAVWDRRSTISRSASVMDSHVPYDDRQRYQSRSSTLSSSSRLALTPGDSVSVVDRPSQHDSGKKDPLDVLRRIEESREQHKRQWDEDRAVSVLGDFEPGTRRYDRPSSGDARAYGSPQSLARPRPATSMSSVRDAFDRDAPRSPPVHRLHRRAVEDAQLESPSARRATSRLSHGPPVTEPRQMRSSTSLGSAGRTSSLDAHSTKTEHGRLLLESFRALELKLPPELLAAVPDLVRALQATIVAQENINSSVRDSLAIASQTNVAIDLDQPDIHLLRRDFDILLPLLRDASRASDQSIRELTRVILDLPKLMREGSRLSAASVTPDMRATQSQSPTVRRSGSLLSRSSIDSTRSPDVDQRRWQQSPSSPISNTYGGGVGAIARERRSLDVIRSSSSMASFVSRFQRSPKKSEGAMPLPPIDQSPPREHEAQFPAPPRDYRPSESRSARNGDRILDSPPHRNENRYYPSSPPSQSSPPPPSRSPDRFRNMLKKKASSTSTHTVRGSTAGLGFAPLSRENTSRNISHGGGGGSGGGSGSAFFPSPVRRTTTAISQITVGDKSVRSDRSGSIADELELEVGSPVSRFSFQGRAGSEEVEEEGDEGDAVKMLAAAAKRREVERGAERTEAGRWKSAWGRRTSK